PRAALLTLKTLMRKAAPPLLKMGMAPDDAKTLLGRGMDLARTSGFWDLAAKGVCLFLSQKTIRVFKLPAPFASGVFVGRQFHIKPLLAMMEQEGRYGVLALSQNNVRLFVGERTTPEKISLEEVPESVAETMRYDDTERQMHTRPQGSRNNRRAGMFHGHGAHGDTLKTAREHHIHLVAKGVSRILKGSDFPLVLAGVDYLCAMYQKYQTYPHLVAQPVYGNPDKMDGASLMELAGPLAAPWFMQTHGKRLREILLSAPGSRVVHDLSAILKASGEGRVEALLMSEGDVWGRFDTASGMAEPHYKPIKGDVELTGWAACETLAHGGEIIIPPPAMTQLGGDPMVALLRY
ncbi:MAG: hypothetical protein OEW12_09130, partial [Deltaproteobacteria bacterium]|nr:hypothetical protein [Deltaproteobacteria bacterium]